MSDAYHIMIKWLRHRWHYMRSAEQYLFLIWNGSWILRSQCASIVGLMPLSTHRFIPLVRLNDNDEVCNKAIGHDVVISRRRLAEEI